MKNVQKSKNRITRNESFDEAFENAPMLGLIMKMALPCVAAQLVNLLYSIVDRIFIGHIPEIGADALAGVGVCSTIIILVSAFANFVGGGGAPLCSIALGQGRREHAEKILSQGFTFLIVFTVLTAVPVYLLMDPILTAIGASKITLPYARTYLAIYLAGTFFVMVNIGLTPFLNVQGKTRFSMIAVIIGAILNIILDPVLMFGFGMGVAGAAVATVVSQAVSAGYILRFLFRKNTPLHISGSSMKPEGDIVKSTLALGASPFTMTATESLIGFIMNSGLAGFGDIYVSALTIMQSAMQFVSVPLSGFANGYSPVVSYNYGHRSPERVREAARIGMIVMAGCNFIGMMIMILFPAQTAGIFTDDPDLIDMVQKTMPLFLAGMTIFGLQRACQAVFVALEQAHISLFIALLRKVILLIPLALILPVWFGVTGVYAAEAVADATAATICTLLFARKFPRILQSIALQDGPEPKKESPKSAQSP